MNIIEILSQPFWQRMGMTLRAIANDGNFLALDEVYVSVTIIIDTHC